MNDQPKFTDSLARYMLWQNVPTFLNCPFVNSPENVEIALVGVPYSGGNGIQRMQYLAPRAVRTMSMGHHRSHRKLQINPFELCVIRDLGDTPITLTIDPMRSLTEIQAFFARVIQAGAIPVSIGGDHSITLPILRAIAGPDSPRGGPIGLIHLDAHTDTYPSSEPGEMAHAANVFAFAVKEGLIDPKRTVQVGVRGPMADLRQDDWAHAAGFRIIETEEFFETGV